MLRYRYLTLALAACTALAGCGSKTNYKYRVAVIPKGTTHEHWQSVHRGAERAAEDLAAQGISVEVLWEGPKRESDADEQIGIVDRKLGMGIHGLVLAPQHSKQMVLPVERAVEQGVPAVIFDSNLDPAALEKNPGLTVKYVATDNYRGGRLAAERLLGVLAKEGKTAPKLVLFRYAVGSESTEQRERGFLDSVNQRIEKQKQAGEPAIQVISDDQYAGATVDTAREIAGPMLNALRDRGIDGIFAVNESATTGLLQAMRTQGLINKVRVMGFDSSAPLRQALRDDEVVGLVVQDPYRMGYLGVWHVVMHLEGYDVGEGGKTLYTGEYVLVNGEPEGGKDFLIAIEDERAKGLFDPEFQKRRTVKTPEYKKR